MSTITTSHTSGFEVGDHITMTTPDRRKWKRFLHWITFREPPVIVTHHRVTSVQGATTMEVGP